MSPTRRPDSWAPYMTWAKHHPPARYDLRGSNLLHCTLDELPGGREALELYAHNDEGYPPLVEAIARRYGVATERVATATGAAGANFLTLGALIRPGDTVLAEWPGYDPMAGAARFLGAHVSTFERSWDDGFRVNPDRIAHELTPGHARDPPDEPAQPDGRLHRRVDARGGGRDGGRDRGEGARGRGLPGGGVRAGRGPGRHARTTRWSP